MFDRVRKVIRFRLHRFWMMRLPVSARFQKIYRERHWGGTSSESASGLGSSLQATETIRAELPLLVQKLGIQKLLDIGCGDFNWMKHVDLPVPYIGADIVPEVIEDNRRLYGKEGIEFMVLDGTKDPIPDDVDAILCREVLFHLSFEHALALLANVNSSNARYLIATQIDSQGDNQDTFTGGFRPLDLRRAPFGFPKPLAVIPDDRVSANRSLCVWQVLDIGDA